MKQKIIHYFNQGASTYHIACDFQANVAQQLASRLITVSPRNILEIGCGTGLLSQHLVSLFPAASMLLTDIAPAMIESCKKRFANQSQIKTACMDAEALTTQNKFDLITSSMTLHWFDNPVKSFQDIKNNLLPGGKFIFSMLGEKSLLEWREMCEKFQINSIKRRFPAKESILNFIPDLQLDVRVIQQRYVSAHAFLSSLKSLGARAADIDQQPESPAKLRRLLRHYSNEITVSYEVIFGYYCHPERSEGSSLTVLPER